jgi:hypothetical protein
VARGEENTKIRSSYAQCRLCFLDWRPVSKPVPTNFVLLRCRNANVVRLTRESRFRANCKNVCDAGAHFHLQHVDGELTLNKWMYVYV